jgi:hypothetical protein
VATEVTREVATWWISEQKDLSASIIRDDAARRRENTDGGVDLVLRVLALQIRNCVLHPNDAFYTFKSYRLHDNALPTELSCHDRQAPNTGTGVIVLFVQQEKPVRLQARQELLLSILEVIRYCA